MGISSVSWPKPFPPRPKRDWNLPKRWRGLTVSDVRTSPTPYVQDALAQPSNRILAPRRSWDGHTGVVFGEPLRKSQGSSHCHARQELKIKGTRLSYPRGDTDESAGATNDLNSFRSWAGHTEAAVTASRFSHGSSADVPDEIEDQRDFKAQNAPCGATPTYRQERPMISIPCRNLAPNDGMPSGDTSEDASIASARQGTSQHPRIPNLTRQRQAWGFSPRLRRVS